MGYMGRCSSLFSTSTGAKIPLHLSFASADNQERRRAMAEGEAQGGVGVSEGQCRGLSLTIATNSCRPTSGFLSAMLPTSGTTAPMPTSCWIGAT